MLLTILSCRRRPFTEAGSGSTLEKVSDLSPFAVSHYIYSLKFVLDLAPDENNSTGLSVSPNTF